MTSLAPVQASVGPAMHIEVEQPVDDDAGTFDPSNFAESVGRFVLVWMGRELSQQLARRKSAAGIGWQQPDACRW